MARTNIHLLLQIGIAVLLILVSQNDPFFWDTIQLASRHAHFFYENGLVWQVLPAEMDSGHPPVFGYYLAWVWHLAGKNLSASHWAMFPFLFLAINRLFALGKRISDPSWAIGLLALAIADPVFAGQSSLISPDIVLIACFLGATEALLGQKRFQAALWLVGLSCISMRGMLTAAALGMWEGYQMIRRTGISGPNFSLRFLAPFIPGGILAGLFLIWHFYQTGWVGHHPDSPWSPAFQRVGISGFFRNFAIVGWRWTDLGRIFEWLLVGVLFLKSRKSVNRELVELWVCLAILLLPSALIYQNLTAHRYFWPWFAAGHLIVFQWLWASDFALRVKRLFLACAIAGLATGNLWIYPRGISMDWDATLAHKPYHRLRADFIQYLDQHSIDFSQVGSAFPNLADGETLSLNGEYRKFAEIDYDKNEYILVSNVFNDVQQEDYKRLSNWVLEKKMEQNGIFMELYRKY